MTNVLFICARNAGRSQMAQALFERYAPPIYQVRSAGSDPAEGVHPEVVEVMRELGIDLSDRGPQALTRELVEQADVVVTMGCQDEFPHVPGKRYIDWQIADPAGRAIEEVREIRDDIATRAEHLVRELGSLLASLPLEQAFGLLDEGVLVIGRAGDVISANPAACSLLERTERELRVPDALLELDVRTREGVAVPQQRSFGTHVLATGHPARDVIVSAAKRDGSRLWLSLNYQPLMSAAGAVEGMVLSIRRHSPIAMRDSSPSSASAGVSERPLTNREQEVVRLIALGYEGREIAEELGISAETVRTHISRAMAKVGAHSRTQLVARVLGGERTPHPANADQ